MVNKMSKKKMEASVPESPTAASKRKSSNSTGPKDFSVNDLKEREGDWMKIDGHASLFQEDPINDLDVLEISTAEDGTKWR